MIKDKKYFWCRCNMSKKAPFCDGSHKGTAIKPLAYIAEETNFKIICNCTKTNNPPFCDGSHNN